jgi:hypothetical protein
MSDETREAFRRMRLELRRDLTRWAKMCTVALTVYLPLALLTGMPRLSACIGVAAAVFVFRKPLWREWSAAWYGRAPRDEP